jgi:hypothetical protein
MGSEPALIIMHHLVLEPATLLFRLRFNTIKGSVRPVPLKAWLTTPPEGTRELAFGWILITPMN